MTLAFVLSMPNVGSWNGKWSGEGKLYADTRSFRSKANIEKAEQILQKGSYYYRWPDGWGASIEVRYVEGNEIAKVRRKSSGFCGYDWMIDSIVKHGRIVTESDLEKEASRGNGCLS